MLRPELDRVHQGAEVVVGEHQAGRLLGDLAAGAHRDADVGLLDGGGVVDGVARHGDHQALLLHELDEPELVLGGDAAEHVQVRQPLQQLLVGEGGQLGSADRARAEAQLPADRARGHRVVAGDHADLDAGLQGDLDGHLGGGPQRVDDADQADEHELLDVGHRVGDEGGLVGRREEPRREGERAQTLLGEPLHLRLDVGAHVLQRDGLAGTGEGVRAALQHDVRAALDHLDERPVAAPGEPVGGRHELVRRVERHLRDAGVRPAALLRVDPQLGGEHHEGGLGRVADHGAGVGHGRVAGQAQAVGERGQVRHVARPPSAGSCPSSRSRCPRR